MPSLCKIAHFHQTWNIFLLPKFLLRCLLCAAHYCICIYPSKRGKTNVEVKNHFFYFVCLSAWNATKIQSFYRRELCMKNYIFYKQCTTLLQAVMRSKLARDDCDRKQRVAAATAIQKFFRSKVQRLQFLRIVEKITKIQAQERRIIAKKRVEKLRLFRAATRIQSRWLEYEKSKIYLLYANKSFLFFCATTCSAFLSLICFLTSRVHCIFVDNSPE